MKKYPSERNIVVVLFVLVLITFSFAERESKKLEHSYTKAIKLYNQFNLAFHYKKTNIGQNINSLLTK